MKICDEIIRFGEQLYFEEKSENTVKKYIRDVKVFIDFINKNSFHSDGSINK